MLWGMRRFIDTMGTNPEELLSERIKESLSTDPNERFHAENRLREFLKRQGTTSGIWMVGAALKSFCGFHRYDLHERLVS
jgi:hypothetical protein